MFAVIGVIHKTYSSITFAIVLPRAARKFNLRMSVGKTPLVDIAPAAKTVPSVVTVIVPFPLASCAALLVTFA